MAGWLLFALYRFLKISSEIPKVGISGSRKKGRLTDRFFDNRYKCAACSPLK